jgi:transcriptional regulator with PAS, ATPase and Fis domain
MTIERKPAEATKAPKTLSEIMASHERIIILQALRLNGFSRKKTAASLSIGKTCLWQRMRKLKITYPEIPKDRRGRPRKLTCQQLEEPNA